MPTVKLHYDGWICLPASLCRALGLGSGDRLAAELADGAITLRPLARQTGQHQQLETAASPATSQAQEIAPDGDSVPARRKPGRPRKDAVAEFAPPGPRKRGRPRKAVDTPEPEPAPDPNGPRQPWILRKKAELPPAAPAVDKLPALERRPEQPRSHDDMPLVERRPFRQVEVRKLGPGRGHNRVPRLPD
jgi:antitoxin component of MazEF toxin-antitoxin module